MLFASPLAAPQLLAFPHRTETAIGTIWSEQTLDPALIRTVARDTARKVAASPLAQPTETRPIFITEGGWRWRWLANRAASSLAITRPITSAVVVNRTDPKTGVVRNGITIGGERDLASILAHEFTHGMIRNHFGQIRAITSPQWMVEGYCDYVSGTGSLTDADAARLEKAGTDHPALPYYHGRRRVASILARNGGSVDDLFQTEP